jgi:hypothetical protein
VDNLVQFHRHYFIMSPGNTVAAAKWISLSLKALRPNEQHHGWSLSYSNLRQDQPASRRPKKKEQHLVRLTTHCVLGDGSAASRSTCLEKIRNNPSNPVL